MTRLPRLTRANHYLDVLKDGQRYRLPHKIAMFEDAWEKANEIADATGYDVEIWFRGECIHTSTPKE